MSWKADTGGIVPEARRDALLRQEESWVPHTSFTFRPECRGAFESLEASWSLLPPRGHMVLKGTREDKLKVVGLCLKSATRI